MLQVQTPESPCFLPFSSHSLYHTPIKYFKRIFVETLRVEKAVASAAWYLAGCTRKCTVMAIFKEEQSAGEGERTRAGKSY